ncbi:MAG: hypothetical protein KatS3mg015_1124 [Fimbriimonadales bacterium]|nr:MAG: hypothetical protein KatS3mg015_1124 [Fimbriimonadales bacterium]
MRTVLFAALGLVVAAGFQGQGRPPELKVGDPAPDFKLKWLHEDKTFQLSSNFGKKPTVLIFGSYT